MSFEGLPAGSARTAAPVPRPFAGGAHFGGGAKLAGGSKWRPAEASKRGQKGERENMIKFVINH